MTFRTAIADPRSRWLSGYKKTCLTKYVAKWEEDDHIQAKGREWDSECLVDPSSFYYEVRADCYDWK